MNGPTQKVVQVINLIAKPGTDPLIPLACCSRLDVMCPTPGTDLMHTEHFIYAAQKRWRGAPRPENSFKSKEGDGAAV